MIQTFARLWQGRLSPMHARYVMAFGYVATLITGLAIITTAHTFAGITIPNAAAHGLALAFAGWAFVGVRRCSKPKPPSRRPDWDDWTPGPMDPEPCPPRGPRHMARSPILEAVE